MSDIPPTPPPIPPPPPRLPPMPSPATAGPLGPAARGSPPARQSFGEQAARFSLYAPLMVILLACLSRGGDEAGVGLAIAWINVALVVMGFVLGAAALVSMRFYGRERILGRALVGVLVNGLLLASVTTLVLPVYRVKQVRDRAVGHWQVVSQAGKAAPSARIEIDLAADGIFRLTRDDGAGGVASYSGKWRLDRKRTLGVEVQRVESGDPSSVGQTIGLGTVTSVDGNRMVLTTGAGEDVLRRLP